MVIRHTFSETMIRMFERLLEKYHQTRMSAETRAELEAACQGVTNTLSMLEEEVVSLKHRVWRIEKEDAPQ